MKITPEQMGYLKKLKDIDHSILTIQTEKKEAPRLIESLEKKVSEANAAKDKANANLEELQLAQMQVEEDLKDANERLKHANVKLQNISNDYKTYFYILACSISANTPSAKSIRTLHIF